uniref:Uncharacterized protein n=1 Tax=Arundo donax TaxID=35708 RepID=A0A0A9BQ67_ARUDO
MPCSPHCIVTQQTNTNQLHCTKREQNHSKF